MSLVVLLGDGIGYSASQAIHNAYAPITNTGMPHKFGRTITVILLV